MGSWKRAEKSCQGGEQEELPGRRAGSRHGAVALGFHEEMQQAGRSVYGGAAA